jgi:hypothetical protein
LKHTFTFLGEVSLDGKRFGVEDDGPLLGGGEEAGPRARAARQHAHRLHIPLCFTQQCCGSESGRIRNKLMAGSGKNHFRSGSGLNDKLIKKTAQFPSKMHNFNNFPIFLKKFPEKHDVTKNFVYVLQKIISRRNFKDKVRVCRPTLFFFCVLEPKTCQFELMQNLI